MIFSSCLNPQVHRLECPLGAKPPIFETAGARRRRRHQGGNTIPATFMEYQEITVSQCPYIPQKYYRLPRRRSNWVSGGRGASYAVDHWPCKRWNMIKAGQCRPKFRMWRRAWTTTFALTLMMPISRSSGAGVWPCAEPVHHLTADCPIRRNTLWANGDRQYQIIGREPFD